MPGMTQFAKNESLNITTRTGTRVLALFTAAPTDDGGGTEVPTTGAGAGYSRVDITTAFPDATTGGTTVGGFRQVANTSPITFGPITGAGVSNITHYGIYDSTPGGATLRWWSLLTADDGTTPLPRNLSNNSTLTFPIGSLIIQQGNVA
jgi:hypothetical protein